MNILVFSWRDPKHPLSGGAEQVMHEHMKGWVESGHKITLFSSYVNGLPKEEVLDGIKIIRSGKQLVGVQINAFFWYLFREHDKFDLVVDQFHGLPFFTPIYVRIPKLAVIQEVTGNVWFLNHLPKPFNWIIGLAGYVTEPIYFWFYRGVQFMTGSNSAKEDIIKMGIPAKNIHIIPHGVIIPKLKISRKKEKIKTIVFLGALARDKGIEDALRVFAILDKKGKFNFWVIGKVGKDYDTHLNDLCKQLGIYEKVKFWGFVSQKEKFELLAKSHVLVNPSVREGWGLVNIEANSMETPVVAYNSPGLVDSVKDEVSGVICKENTPLELASNVDRILSSSEEYGKLQIGALKWSRNFTWKKARKESIELIESL